jgi:hypothetical protein
MYHCATRITIRICLMKEAWSFSVWVAIANFVNDALVAIVNDYSKRNRLDSCVVQLQDSLARRRHDDFSRGGMS